MHRLLHWFNALPLKHAVSAFVFCATLALFNPANASAQVPTTMPSLDGLLDSLATVRNFREVALSPDGKYIAWVEAIPEGKLGPGPRSAIYISSRFGRVTKPFRITAGDGKSVYDEHGLAWSPDSTSLVFLSDRDKKEQLQLYVVPVVGGRVQKLTDLRGYVAQPRWSPDGKFIAFLFVENAVRIAGPVHPATPEVGVVGENTPEQRLAILNPSNGKVRSLSPADLYIYEYDWSPNSKSFVVIGAHGSGENNWYIAQLYTLGLANGELKSILKPAMQIAVPRWSPDGQNIAFIGGLMSDEGANGGDIYVMPATGGIPRNITPGMRASASWLSWLPFSQRILFTEHIDGGSGIGMVDAARGGTKTLWTGSETVLAEHGTFGLSLTADGNITALIRHSPQKPPEIYVGTPGNWQQLTQVNAALKPSWGELVNLHWQSDDFNVQGWLLYPEGYDGKRRYPMLVSIHGGPASCRKPTWPVSFFDLSVMASQGYFVFFPNPRGSFGAGERFTNANVKDFGHGDLRDILAGVDKALQSASIDEKRIGVAGWSYGGYMTMWAVTQTNRFRSAVAGAGISNWQSYYGQNGIDQWLLPYFGATVYDDPAVYARSSPINFIKNVKTPTLMVVGDRDLECPVPQSYEFWHALKTLGVPNQFVIYPNEGHLISKMDHRRDITRRMLEWTNKYCRDAGVPPR